MLLQDHEHVKKPLKSTKKEPCSVLNKVLDSSARSGARTLDTVQKSQERSDFLHIILASVITGVTILDYLIRNITQLLQKGDPVMEKLYDVLAGITAADDELKDMIEILENLKDFYERDHNARIVLRLVNRWLNSLKSDTDKITNTLDEFILHYNQNLTE